VEKQVSPPPSEFYFLGEKSMTNSKKMTIEEMVDCFRIMFS